MYINESLELINTVARTSHKIILFSFKTDDEISFNSKQFSFGLKTLVSRIFESLLVRFIKLAIVIAL